MVVQANGAKPYGRPDSVFVPSLPPERPDTAVPRPIGAPPPLPPPRQPSALETLRASAEPQSKLSPTMKNKQMMIIRDAERRIYLAHESLKQKSKGKAKREKKLRKEEKARQKAAEKLKKQQAKHHKKATRVYITDNRGRKSTASVDNHDYRYVNSVLRDARSGLAFSFFAGDGGRGGGGLALSACVVCSVPRFHPFPNRRHVSAAQGCSRGAQGNGGPVSVSAHWVDVWRGVGVR